MTDVVLPNTLTPGTPQDVSKVQANDEALRDGFNTRTGALEARFPVATTDIADGAVSVAKTGTADSGLARGSFSARKTNSITTVNGTYVTILFNTEDWDVSSWYDTATGRFTPQVSGIYRISAAFFLALVAGTAAQEDLALHKNGTLEKWIDSKVYASGFNPPLCGGSALVSLNGSTDYVDMRVKWSAGGGAGVPTVAYMQGELVGRT